MAIKSGDIWILSKTLHNKLVFCYKGIETRKFSVPIKATRRTLRRPSSVNTIDITNESDYVIVDIWDEIEFNKLREATSYKLSTTFMEKFKRDVEARMGNFFIVRRLNLAAPNTYTLAFFSNIECAPTKLVWSTKVPKNRLKLIAAFFNSTINLLQTVLSRAETEGAFIDLSEYILLDFYIPDLQGLSQQDTRRIIQAFEKMSKRPLPSLMDQIKKKDSDRIALDKAWLQALKFSGDIDEILNWLYCNILDQRVFLRFVPHHSVNRSIATAIMFKDEIKLAATSNTGLVMLDGSIFTPIIALNFGISQCRDLSTEASIHLEDSLTDFFLDYKKILENRDKIYVACLKGTERKDISNIMNWDHNCNELWLMDKVLLPGEHTEPSPLGRLDKNATAPWDISYVYKRFNDNKLDNVISEVETLLNNTSFCFYKPDKSSRVLRLEFPLHNIHDEKKFATLLASIKNGSCKNALIKEPELLYLADRQAKEIHTVMNTMKMLMPSTHYRTESIFMD